MAGNSSDSSIATGPTNLQSVTDQLELSQKVQDLAFPKYGHAGSAITSDSPLVGGLPALQHVPTKQSEVRAAGRDAQLAAPADKWDKFVAVTEEGIKATPQGIWHALHNPLGLAENAAISLGVGVAAKALLPESGPLGSLFAIGLGAYFAEQTAVPVYKAYRTGMQAHTMGDINLAGNQLGDAFGGLAVNLPIGIVGYKLGAGLGDRVVVRDGKLSGGVETTNKPETSPQSGRIETTDRVETTPLSDRAASPLPSLPDRYQPVQENFSGTTVPGISQEYLKNLQTDDTGQYYGAGLRYPDVMADPEMATFIDGHNQLTMSTIDKAIYDQELANEAKASGYKLPPDWENGHPGPPANAIDVTDGGDGKMRVGSKTFTLTDDGAPNRKLIVSDDLHPGKVTTLIPESKDFEMQQVIQVKANGADNYAVVGSKDGASVLHLYDENGKAKGAISLPGFGTLHDVRAGASPSQLQFLYDTPIAHPRVLMADLATGKGDFSPLSSDVFNTDNFVTDKIMVPYADVEGKMQNAPVYVSHSKSMALNGQNPAMFKIYGGFDVGPQYIGYSLSTASWLEGHGGVAVDPVLPGDGGLGKGNYQEGVGAGMENVNLALTAIIEKLHDMGISSPEKTGIYGRSDGGRAVNTFLNRRPELIGAAVSESGVNSIFDSPVINVDTGQYWTSDFGDPSNADQVGWMAKLDVLKNLDAAKKYPPTLIEIGTKDGVVNVGNGITYHAIRQQMANGETLLYSRIGEGHDPVNLNLALQTAFLWSRLKPPMS
jgi:hypothetical protein